MQPVDHQAEVTAADKVAIFGAGAAGQAAYAHLCDRYEIAYFIDNDLGKHGQEIHGKPIYGIEALTRVPVRRVLIASEFFEQISQQIEALGLDIPLQVLPARMLTAKQFGADRRDTEKAVALLHQIGSALNEAALDHYADAGTLLGIIRDGQLIPWDDDLDFSVKGAQVKRVLDTLNRLLPSLAETTGESWECQSLIASEAFGAVPQGAVRAIKLRPVNPDSDYPLVDFFVKYIGDQWMDYCLASRGIRMPRKHFDRTETVVFEGQEVRVPQDPEGYLTTHYGDWRTPKKDWHLGDLSNTTVF